MKLPDGPFFVPPYKPNTGGVDFLGMRQVNLSLAFESIPGINNVTKRVRPFSVASWIFWKAHDLLDRDGESEFKKADLDRFREKIETLFTWGHMLRGVSGVPGTDSEPPAGSGPVSLRSAVQYGPATKTIGGLGFLAPSEKSVYRTTGRGVALAEAMDSQLRKRKSYRVLDMFEGSRASADQAQDLFEAWSVDKPTQKERTTLRGAYFDEGAIGTASDLGNRSSTLAMAIAILKRASTPLEAYEVREAMVSRRINGHSVSLLDRLIPAWYRWAVLQVRQTQRLALESIFAWAEWQIIKDGVRSSESLADNALAALWASESPKILGLTLDVTMSSLLRGVTSGHGALVIGEKDELLSIFELRYLLVESVDSKCDNAIALAIQTLLLCARITDILGNEEPARRFLARGKAERISLWHWADVIRRLSPLPLRTALLHIIENFILSQHFATAVMRFDGRTQRLRICIEEEGLCPLVSRPWRPAVSPDRLDAALALGADCGLIQVTRDGSFFWE